MTLMNEFHNLDQLLSNIMFHAEKLDNGDYVVPAELFEALRSLLIGE